MELNSNYSRRYHNGSIALAALIFPPLQLTRMVIDFFYHKLKFSEIPKLVYMKNILCLPVFSFSGKYLNTFNKNALVMVCF